MKLKKNIAVSESGFVFDPSSGDSFTTNPIGLEIIQLLKQNKKTSEINSTITKLYAIEKTVFEKDFNDFVFLLQRLKLTE